MHIKWISLSTTYTYTAAVQHTPFELFSYVVYVVLCTVTCQGPLALLMSLLYSLVYILTHCMVTDAVCAHDVFMIHLLVPYCAGLAM